MTDYQDNNPYASPQYGAEPAAMVVEEIVGAWRDRDELVLSSGNAKPPKACCATNRVRPIVRYSFGVETRLRNAMLAALCIPLIGLPLSGTAYLVCRLIGVRRETAYIWVPPHYLVWDFLSGAVFGLLVSANILLSNLAVFLRMPSLGIIAAPLIGLQIFLFGYIDGAYLGLPYFSSEPGVVRVRGVHPDYLARLPEYDGADTTAAKTVEPAESPFGDGTA